MKRLVLMVSFIAFFTVGGQVVYGCTCGEIVKPGMVVNDNAPQPDPEEVKRWRLEQTEFAFFTGSVVKIQKVKVRGSDGSNHHSPMKRVTVRVEKYWLGVNSPRMIIYTGVGGGDCGVSYVKGNQYFFWASRSRVSGLLETGICSPSRITDTLVNDFNELFGSAREFL